MLQYFHFYSLFHSIYYSTKIAKFFKLEYFVLKYNSFFNKLDNYCFLYIKFIEDFFTTYLYYYYDFFNDIKINCFFSFRINCFIMYLGSFKQKFLDYQFNILYFEFYNFTNFINKFRLNDCYFYLNLPLLVYTIFGSFMNPYLID